MREILKRKPFWMIISSHTTDCMCHSVLIVHLVPIAIEAGISHVQASSLVGVLGLGTLIGRISGGMLADRIGAKRALFTALTTQTLPVPLLFWIDSPFTFYAVALMVGIGLGGHGTMYPVITREYYGPKRVGILFGTFITGASSGMATGGFIGGLLHDLTGNVYAVHPFQLPVRCRVAALCALLSLKGKAKQRKGSDAPPCSDHRVMQLMQQTSKEFSGSRSLLPSMARIHADKLQSPDFMT